MKSFMRPHAEQRIDTSIMLALPSANEILQPQTSRNLLPMSLMPKSAPATNPKKESTLGNPPGDLSDVETSTWYTIAEDMPRLGKEHRELLRMYCIVAARLARAEEVVGKDGPIVITGQGQAQLTPWVKREESLRKQAQGLLGQLIKAQG